MQAEHETTCIMVHGNISASQYTLHIILTKETGSMQFASCNCKAGLSGVCSHVGGLLFTVKITKIHVPQENMNGNVHVQYQTHQALKDYMTFDL